MTNNDPADKLRARVQDWQSYLGKSEHPWGSAPSSDAPSAPPSEPVPSAPAPQQESAHAEQAAKPVAVAEPVVEVIPPQQNEPQKPRVHHTVVEVIQPEPATRPYDIGPGKKRNSHRALEEAELKGVLFSDPRQVESEFQHVRRANAVLSIFLIVMVGILCSVVAWHLVD
jgi:hypothetical protein